MAFTSLFAAVEPITCAQHGSVYQRIAIDDEDVGIGAFFNNS